MLGDKKQAPQKAVAVHMVDTLGKKPMLLFSARQAEEVLPTAQVQPLPFAPDWLLGLCAWRQQVLPVLDLARLYGFDSLAERYTYLVVRTVVAAEQDNSQKLFRCILKVSNRIAACDLPKQCVSISAQESGLDPRLVRGIFAHEDELLIVPDLRPVLSL